MKYRIIQIIPAPGDMVQRTYLTIPDESRVYADVTEEWRSIVCLALVEDERGRRSVKPMACGNTEIQLIDCDYENSRDDITGSSIYMGNREAVVCRQRRTKLVI